METLQDKIARDARKCSKCGHEWLKKPNRTEPDRCPNHKCRSKKWNLGSSFPDPDQTDALIP